MLGNRFHHRVANSDSVSTAGNGGAERSCSCWVLQVTSASIHFQSAVLLARVTANVSATGGGGGRGGR